MTVQDFDHNDKPALLEVEDLTVSFTASSAEDRDHTETVLNKVSFVLRANTTLGIVGESGSGKSVTALSLLGLIPSPPLHRISGHIRYRGRELIGLGNRQYQQIRGKEIGIIFQEPMSALNPVLTIGDQLTETIRVHEQVNHKTARQKAVSLLAEVRIPSPRDRLACYPHEMSGGMRQRVMIAIALAGSPSLLIADEPTTALDVTIQAQILDLFRQIQRRRRMAILFISHDLGVIAEIADAIVVMKNGEIIEHNDIVSLFDRPQHAYTRKLLQLSGVGAKKMQ